MSETPPMNDKPDLPYVYVWNRPENGPRKGQRCRVVARGKMNSCQVEFADGFTMITSRNAIRKFKDDPSHDR